MSRYERDLPPVPSTDFLELRHELRCGTIPHIPPPLERFGGGSIAAAAFECPITICCRLSKCGGGKAILKNVPETFLLPEKHEANVTVASACQIWGHNLQVRHQINLMSSSLKASIRSVSWHTSNDKILVGTAGTPSDQLT